MHPQCMRGEGAVDFRLVRPLIRHCAKPCKSLVTWDLAHITAKAGTMVLPRSARGEELVGILGHLDVVPPGKLQDWERGPF